MPSSDPALVVSPDGLNAVRNDVLVIAISSQLPSIPSADEFLIPVGELDSCGLPKPSIVKLSKLVSLHRQLIVRRIGALPVNSLLTVLKQLRELFT